MTGPLQNGSCCEQSFFQRSTLLHLFSDKRPELLPHFAGRLFQELCLGSSLRVPVLSPSRLSFAAGFSRFPLELHLHVLMNVESVSRRISYYDIWNLAAPAPFEDAGQGGFDLGNTVDYGHYFTGASLSEGTGGGAVTGSPAAAEGMSNGRPHMGQIAGPETTAEETSVVAGV